MIHMGSEFSSGVVIFLTQDHWKNTPMLYPEKGLHLTIALALLMEL